MVTLYIVVCLLVIIMCPRKYVLSAFIFNSFLLAMLAFNISEQNQHDLIFHWDLYDYYTGKPFSNVMLHYYFKQSPLYCTYVYLLTFLGSHRYLSAISTFLGYFSISKILHYFIAQKGLNKYEYVTIYMVMICTLPWQDYSAGIRGALAFTVCVVGAFEDFEKERPILSIICYGAALFIHQSIALFIGVRLLALITRNTNQITKLITIVFTLMVSIFANGFYNIVSLLANASGISVLHYVAHSINSYLIHGKEFYEYGVVIVRVSAIVLLLWIAYNCSCYYINIDEYEQNSRLIWFFSLLVCTTIGFIGQYDTVCRYSVVCIMMAPLILNLCHNTEAKIVLGDRDDYAYTSLLSVLSIFTLVYYHKIYYSLWIIGE